MWSVPEYTVDVIIPVHSAARQIERAAASVLEQTQAHVRVLVIAHNIDPRIIQERLGSLSTDPRLEILSLNDGVHSPANPRNFGLEQATASFVSFLDSDDELSPGAIDSWLAVQERTGADAILAKIYLANGRIDPYPPVRPGWKNRYLNPVRDRLAYRSVPVGLLSRPQFQHLRYTENIASGEDLTFSLTTWFTGHRLIYDFSGPGYIYHADADDRVTSEQRPLEEDFLFLDALESTSWFSAATPLARQAIIVKFIRMHFFDALQARSNGKGLNDVDFASARQILTRLLGMAPGALELLSSADRRVLDAMHSSTPEPTELQRLLVARQRFATLAALTTRNPLRILHAQAPFRTLLAGSLLIRCAARHSNR